MRNRTIKTKALKKRGGGGGKEKMKKGNIKRNSLGKGCLGMFWTWGLEEGTWEILNGTAAWVSTRTM